MCMRNADHGRVHILSLVSGDLLLTFDVVVPRPTVREISDQVSSKDNARWGSTSTLAWVEQLCWSSDGSLLAAGAGRVAVVAR